MVEELFIFNIGNTYRLMDKFVRQILHAHNGIP